MNAITTRDIERCFMGIDINSQFSECVRIVPDLSESGVASVAKPPSKRLGFVAMVQMHAPRTWYFIADFAVRWFWPRRSDFVPPSTQVVLFSLFILGSPAFVLLQIPVSMDKVSSGVTSFLAELTIWISTVFARSIPIKLVAGLDLLAPGAFFHEVN
jgi:hypothetical protein